MIPDDGPEHLEVAAEDGVPLRGLLHRAKEERTAPCLVLHGIASHAGWYAGLAELLASGGVTTIVADRRGAGRSGGTPGHMDSWRQVVEDALRIAAATVPDAPRVHLLGLSLGGLFALSAALRHPDRIGRLALFAPALKSRIRVPLHRRLRVLLRSRTNPSRLYEIPFGPGELVDREDWRAALAADPLRTTRVSARFLVQMFAMQKFVRSGLDRIPSPTRVFLAGRDRIIDSESVLDMLRGRSIPFEAEVFPEAAHIIPSSLPRDALLRRLVSHFTAESDPPVEFRYTVCGDAWPADSLPPPPVLNGHPS